MSSNEDHYWHRRLEIESEILQCQLNAASITESPHYLYRPKVYQDGDMWCALLGEDIVVGICGFGASPAEACAAFDKAWYAKLEGKTP